MSKYDDDDLLAFVRGIRNACIILIPFYCIILSVAIILLVKVLR